MKRFLLDKNYGAYLSKMGLSTEEILKKAMLGAPAIEQVHRWACLQSETV